MAERELKQFVDETRQPYQEGEFLANADDLKLSALYVENVQWQHQSIGDKMLLARAAAMMRNASASLLRAEWLLRQTPAQPTKPASSETARTPDQHLTSSPAPEASQEPQTEQEKHTVKLTGRLVRTPEFKTTPRGRKRIGFELAEHHEDGSTTYHKVYALDTFAERAFKQELHKGDLVEIRGTRQQHELPQKDGSIKQVEQVYCYGVTKR